MRHSTLLVSLCSLLIACSGNSDGGQAGASQSGAAGMSGNAASMAGAGAGPGGVAAAGMGGGSNAGAGGETPASAGAAGTSSGGLPIAGSHTLVLQSVSSVPTGEALQPLSVGFDFRLDVRMTAAGWEALIAPRFQPTQALTVAMSGSALTLSPQPPAGSIVVTDDQANGAMLEDDWQTFTLPLTSDGLLTGEVKATGQQRSSYGDSYSQLSMTGMATLIPDHVNPAIDVHAGDPAGQPTAMLPWDPIHVDASKGIDGVALTAKVHVFALGGAQQPWLFATAVAPAVGDPLAWAGSRSVNLFAQSWDAVQPQGAIQLAAAAGVTDPSGNVSTGVTWTTQVLDVGAALSNHDFQGDVASEASWGSATFLGGKSGADSHCESGSCAQLGPVDTDDCLEQRPGIAGRLLASAGDVVSVRYRVNSNVPYLVGVFEVVLSGHDGATTVSPLTIDPSTVTPVDDGSGVPTTFFTDWQTATFAISGAVPLGEIGFEVRGVFLPCDPLHGPGTAITLLVGSVSSGP